MDFLFVLLLLWEDSSLDHSVPEKYLLKSCLNKHDEVLHMISKKMQPTAFQVMVTLQIITHLWLFEWGKDHRQQHKQV